MVTEGPDHARQQVDEHGHGRTNFRFIRPDPASPQPGDGTTWRAESDAALRIALLPGER